jgi:hypothetical protein
MKKIFKQDNLLLGIILGAVTPWILYGIIYYIDMLVRKIFHMYLLLSPSTMQLVSIVVNVFVMRYYLVKLKFDKTGKGVLLLTFIYILAYFAHEFLVK